MEELEDDGISFFTLCKVMFGRWKLLLIITFSIFIIGVLGIHIVIDNSKETYSCKFEYSIPGLDDGYYIDGSKFDYRQLVSYDILTEIKDSDSKYNSIDIKKMYEKNNVAISNTITKDTDTEIVTSYYTISVKSSYFTNKEQAKSFVNDIASYAVNKTIDIVSKLGYKNNITSYAQSQILDTKVQYLIDQKNLLDKKYDKLIEDYGDLVLSDGKKISDYKDTLDMYFKNNSLDSLTYEIEQEGYILPNATYTKNLELQKEEYRRQFNLNLEKINKLDNQRKSLIEAADGKLESVQLDSYNQEIIKLTTANLDIKYDYDIINRKLKLTDPIADGYTCETVDVTNYETKLAAFNVKMESLKDSLVEYTNKYEEVENEIVTNNADVFFANNSVILTTGTIGLVKSAIISLVVGLVVACIVNLIVDHNKLHEEKPVVKKEEIKA